MKRQFLPPPHARAIAENNLQSVTTEIKQSDGKILFVCI